MGKELRPFRGKNGWLKIKSCKNWLLLHWLLPLHQCTHCSMLMQCYTYCILGAGLRWAQVWLCYTTLADPTHMYDCIRKTARLLIPWSRQQLQIFLEFLPVQSLPQVGVYLFSGDYGTVSHCQSWIRPSRVHVMFAIHGLIIRLPMQVDGRESWGTWE